ncbi:nuclear transport factor 2 family protein [Streptomyces sp. NPDC042319]|uniref:nuclear transport factor 2 family protein n=1 Tax=Streptomyces sp. NPDC042319 TaxID=3154332 RepID=UPI0033FFD404
MTDVQDFGKRFGDFVRGILGPGRFGEAVFEHDAGAEGEIRGFLAQLQAAFSRGDIDYIVSTLADEFTTYELVAVDGRPIAIREKAKMREYLTTLFPSSSETQAKTIAATQVVATSTMGLINEEGDVVITHADTTKEHQPLRSSALAIRTKDGWRWRHWHMSEAGPRFRVNAGGIPIDANGDVIPGARVVVEGGVGRVVIDRPDGGGGQGGPGTSPQD